MHVGAEADALHRALDAAVDARGRTHRARGREVMLASSSSNSTCHALACASWMRGMCSERVTTTWSASASAAIRPPS